MDTCRDNLGHLADARTPLTFDDCELHLGDCLEIMAGLPDRSVHLVCADLPYGVTECPWDVRIPLGPLWDQYRRLLVPEGAVVLTAQQPFATDLINSNRAWFRHDLVWDKVAVTGFLDARRRPLRRHESVLVFAPRAPRYNPQMGVGVPYTTNRAADRAEVYGRHRRTRTINSGERFPTSIVEISNANSARRGKVHPTQKPVELMAYLIRTYSNECETVLDNTMGSGSTGVAAIGENRSFVGIEMDSTYFAAAEVRIKAAIRTRQGDGPTDGHDVPSSVAALTEIISI